MRFFWYFGAMIIGHRRNIQYLERVLDRGTLAHAYLFHGPEGVGKKTVAMELAKALLCSAGSDWGPSRRDGARPAKLGGCGACDDCQRVNARAHPDIHLLSVEHPFFEETEKREIGIKSIHELQRRLAQTAWQGRWRVAVIDGAEQLSRDAGAALLKIVEEPRPGVLFFLIAENSGAVVPTLRSRAVVMGFTTVDDAALEPLLEGVASVRRNSLLRMANGRPGVLIRLLGDPQALAAAEGASLRHAKLLAADLPAQFAFAETEGRESGALGALLRDFLSEVRRDFREGLRREPESAEHVPSADITGLARRLRSLLGALSLVESTTVNRRLIADRVFFDLSPKIETP